ncbi:cyclin-D3-3-like [Silene latifolia]|uniref:cyclin-D3-3-like n=1 Tax=Silene latifolia TaxID=37657 RepID=UPI003D77FB82
MAFSELGDDALYCQEDCTFDDYPNDIINDDDNNNDNNGQNPVEISLLFEQDLYWDDDELPNLLSKEVKNCVFNLKSEEEFDPCLGLVRKEAVDWMLKVHSHYNFSGITALLAVNYFDRFMVKFEINKDKQQWMTQLSAVACLSLAAKVEEIHVPLLIDFQVEDSKYVFEAKTIQRMEILVLSTLQWKMNPVTPYSFLDYLTRRFPLKDFLCWEFLRRCERILLSTIADSRYLGYLPSVMAAATILNVRDCFEQCIGDEYQDQLFGVLGIEKEKVQECSHFILEVAGESVYWQSNKRKSVSRPGSPNGVIDITFSSDSSNDSWAVASVSSSPERKAKKLRTSEDRHLERFNNSSVDFLSIHR